MQNEARLPNTLPNLTNGLSKSQIATLVQQSVDAVLENGNVAQVAEVLAVMERFTRSFRKSDRFTNLLRDELLKNHGTLNTASGARIEACEAGTAYDYSNNPAWVHLKNQITDLTEKQKALEETLRRIPAGKMIVDEETGEVFTGPLKSSTSTYRITLAR